MPPNHCGLQLLAGLLKRTATSGQVLAYPLNVLLGGSIENIEGVTSFPDFPPSAKIMGSPHPLIPKKLTT